MEIIPNDSLCFFNLATHFVIDIERKNILASYIMYSENVSLCVTNYKIFNFIIYNTKELDKVKNILSFILKYFRLKDINVSLENRYYLVIWETRDLDSCSLETYLELNDEEHIIDFTLSIYGTFANCYGERMNFELDYDTWYYISDIVKISEERYLIGNIDLDLRGHFLVTNYKRALVDIGYNYLIYIQMDNRNLVKVGQTKDPYKRLKQIEDKLSKDYTCKISGNFIYCNPVIKCKNSEKRLLKSFEMEFDKPVCGREVFDLGKKELSIATELFNNILSEDLEMNTLIERELEKEFVENNKDGVDYFPYEVILNEYGKFFYKKTRQEPTRLCKSLGLDLQTKKEPSLLSKSRLKNLITSSCDRQGSNFRFGLSLK